MALRTAPSRSVVTKSSGMALSRLPAAAGKSILSLRNATSSLKLLCSFTFSIQSLNDASFVLLLVCANTVPLVWSTLLENVIAAASASL